MKHELIDTRDLMGQYGDGGVSLSWVFDLGGYTVELKQSQLYLDSPRMRVRTYRRKLAPLPPKPYMWLGAEAEAA